jgi:hypothetical protein
MVSEMNVELDQLKGLLDGLEGAVEMRRAQESNPLI